MKPASLGTGNRLFRLNYFSDFPSFFWFVIWCTKRQRTLKVKFPCSLRVTNCKSNRLLMLLYNTFIVFFRPLLSRCTMYMAPLTRLLYLEEGWGRTKTSLLKIVLMMNAASSPISREDQEQPAALKWTISSMVITAMLTRIQYHSSWTEKCNVYMLLV